MKLKVFLLALGCVLFTSLGAFAQDDALKVGDSAPDFELETFDDQTVVLSERFGVEGKPVVLLFSRANW